MEKLKIVFKKRAQIGPFEKGGNAKPPKIVLRLCEIIPFVSYERKTRFELATPTLARLCSTS